MILSLQMHSSDRLLLRRIFRNASQTFYWTSRLFPQAVRDDVEALYAFVRIADDCVDILPAHLTRLDALERAAATGVTSDLNAEDTIVVHAFRDVALRTTFDPAWTTAFFTSMRADLSPQHYATMEDTLTYIYGSAEVIGFMMARVMGAPESALAAAGTLGRAFQYINMLRDISVDQDLGRTYIPQTLLDQYEIPSLSRDDAYAHTEAFTRLMQNELSRYREWQAEGEAALHTLPRSCQFAVRAACAAYSRTADVIAENPLSVYDGAYKPSRLSLLTGALTSPFRS